MLRMDGAKVYSYHLDGPHPLSGSVVVSRHAVQDFGDLKFDRELCPRTLRFVKYTGRGENGFDSVISAANGLATAIGRDFPEEKFVDPRQMSLPMDLAETVIGRT